MSDNTNPVEIENCRDVLRIYSDGTIRRSPNPSFNIPIHDDGTVQFKDFQFDPIHNLHLRIYKPNPKSPNLSNNNKLPILYYIHGGGFCIGSRSWPNCQNYCLKLASQLQSVIISPDYRLAPENRLPAAIEDGYKAVMWLKEEEGEDWIGDVADLDRVFVAGDSAGGNIAHHLAVRFGGSGSGEMGRVRVRGYVYLAPFFGGTVRTRFEEEGPKDAFLNLELIDRFWRLSIPEGETTDHPLVNPFGPKSPSLEKSDLGPILVVVGGSDLLKDRAEDYANKLKKWGKKIEYVEFEGQQHGFFTINPDSEPSKKLMLVIKKFMDENSV